MGTFQFETFRDFFEYHLKRYTVDSHGRKQITLQDFAKKIGYSSASSLSMIAKGERLPSASLLESLFQEWKITQQERQTIRLLVEVEKRTQKGKDNFHLARQLHRISKIEKIDLKKFNLISEWYVLVIKILAGTPEFSADPHWISQRLKKKVSPAKAKKALELLVEAKMLATDSITGRLKVTHDYTETTHDVPSEAIRNNHRAMLQRAIEAIDEQDIKNRHLNSVAMQFDKNRLPEAKEKIINFIKQFNAEFSSDNGNQVYQLNMQLFEHTNGGNQNDH